MATDWDVIGKVVTAAVALYGAVMSTFNFIVHRRRDRRSVLLDAAIVPFVDPGNPPDQALVISAVNTGHRKIIVDAIGLRSRRLWLDITKEIKPAKLPPWELADGERFEAWLPVGTLRRLLIAKGRHGSLRLRVWLRDTTLTRWSSPAVVFDIDK